VYSGGQYSSLHVALVQHSIGTVLVQFWFDFSIPVNLVKSEVKLYRFSSGNLAC